MAYKREVNHDFFKKWSSEMAYVLGFFAADGNLVRPKRGGYYLSFYSADRSLISKIKKVMNSSHKLSKRSIRSGEVYRFQVGSRDMYRDLLNIGFVDNKVRRMKLPKIHQKFASDFIRGYFDGDGNVWSGFINKDRKKPTHVLQVSFTSGSIDFLKNFHDLLVAKSLIGGSIFNVKGKQCGRLSFSTLDALKLYGIMYNKPRKLFLKRKKLVFERFIKMRP